MSSPVQVVPLPLRNFFDFLLQSRDTVGLIKVPATILESTTEYLSDLSSVPRYHVEEMLAVIDHEESAVCGRLELQAFTVVYEILSLTEEGPAYERGLALLTQSLYEVSTSSLPENRLRAAKKGVLGDMALLNLIGCFTTTELSGSTRRWMGILALELLKGCDQNKSLLLEKAKGLWRRLDEIIRHGRCHILKLVAGFIVSEIWPDGKPTRDHWPKHPDSKLYRQFPKANGQASQWVVNFERFVCDLAPNSPTTQNSEVMFAYAISVGEKTYCVEEQSAILVTISDELNIVIPSPNTKTANYLDINISQIEEIKTEIKILRFQSRSSTSKLFHVLTIYELKSSEKTYYFNAREFSADSINLVFTSAGAASTVQQSILGIRSRIPCDLGISQSEPIDVSQHLLEDSDEHSAAHLATQLSEDPSNELLKATSPANETYQIDPPTSAAPLSLPDCDESLVDHIAEQQLKTSVASPHGALSPQIMMLVDGAISPVEPHQFDEYKLMTVEYNFDDTSDEESPTRAEKVGCPALWESDQAIWDRQHTLTNGYDGFPANGYSTKSPSIENADCPSSTYYLRTIDQREASRSSTPPSVNVAKQDRQGLPKLTQRMRRNVGEPPVGLSTTHGRAYDDASKRDKRKLEDPRPALKKNVLSPNRQPRVFQSKSQNGGTSKPASSDKHDTYRDEFEFPTSAKKAANAPTAHLATPVAIMSAQGSLKSARQLKIKSMHPPKPPPKPMTKCSSTRPLSQRHIGGRAKASTGTAKYIPSKRTRGNEEDDAMDQMNWKDGCLIDQVKEPDLPQRQRKKLLNRKSQPRTKPIRAKEDLAFSTHKAQNPKVEKSKKSIAVPVPLAQSRSRRVAALIANRKIQGLVESDVSGDEKDIESLHKKGKSTARPGQTERTPTSHSSVPQKSGETSANSRPSLVMPKTYDAQIMDSHDRAMITSASPSVVQSNDENGKAKTLDSVDLPTNELVQPANRVVHDTDTRQRAPVNASDPLPPETYSDQQIQSILPNVTPKILEIQDSATTTNHITLEEQHHVHDITPEIHSSDHAAALDDTGGGFFEEATAFSRDDATSLVKTSTDERTFNPPISDSNSENIHAPNKCEQKNPEDASRVADTCTNFVNSTPKVSIVAKSQGALSCVKSLHFSTKTEDKIQDVSKGEASIRTEVTTPLFDKTVCDQITAHETKKATISRKQAGGPDAMRLDRGLILENRFPYSKELLQPRELQKGSIVKSTPSPITKFSHQTPNTFTRVRVSTVTPHALETAIVAETSESDKVTPVDKISHQRVHKAPKSPSLNSDSGRANAKASKERLEEQIVGAMRVKNPAPVLQRIHQQIGSVKPTNTASKRKSGALALKDDIRAEKTPEAPPDSYRKPNIISFDRKGPRNQGIISSRNVRQIRELEVQESGMSGTVTDKRAKRTIQDFGEDGFGFVQHDGVVKRPRTSIDVPRTREKVTEKVQKRNISIIKEHTQKPSSQSNRVDDNGSPLPLEQSGKVGCLTDGLQVLLKTAARSPSAKKGDDGRNDILMSNDKVEVSNPSPAYLQDLSVPSPLGFRFVPSSYTKHRPSSPNAPSSTIDEYKAHKVDSSGKFVNIRTDTVVTAVRPADPFVGNQRNRQNSFMELLRRSSNIPAQDISKNSATVHEDPDKTLVTGALAQGKNNSDKALGISSSSSSSSDSSQSNKSSSSEGPSSGECGGNDDDDWATALKPHQSETLEVLLEISHRLVSTLVSKETAVNDLASDYRNGGLRILERFEKSRQETLETYRTEIGTLRQELTKMYKAAHHELAVSLKDLESRVNLAAVDDNNNEEAMRKKLQELYALCE